MWWAGGAVMTTLKTIALSVALQGLAVGTAVSQDVQLQVAVEIDCSAYQQNADGSWVVLRANKILERGKVLREIVSGDDLDKPKDGGRSIHRLVGAVCARSKQ
jgi:hypothetical protein